MRYDVSRIVTELQRETIEMVIGSYASSEFHIEIWCWNAVFGNFVILSYLVIEFTGSVLRSKICTLHSIGRMMEHALQQRIAEFDLGL